MKTILTITGPSAGGKTTLERELFWMFGDLVKPLCSTTTREPREEDVPGKSYQFVTHAEFDRMLAGNELVEYTVHSGNKYGLTRPELDRVLAAAEVAVLVCDPHGKEQVAKFCSYFPGYRHVSLFITASNEVRVARLEQCNRLDRRTFMEQVEEGWSSEGYDIVYDQSRPNMIRIALYLKLIRYLHFSQDTTARLSAQHMSSFSTTTGRSAAAVQKLLVDYSDSDGNVFSRCVTREAVVEKLCLEYKNTAASVFAAACFDFLEQNDQHLVNVGTQLLDRYVQHIQQTDIYMHHNVQYLEIKCDMENNSPHNLERGCVKMDLTWRYTGSRCKLSIT